MLAIDFGTTRTKVAYYDPSKGRVSLANLGSGDNVAFPSLFYIGGDGQVFCGSDALDFLDSDPGGTVRRVKSRLRDRAIRVNGQTIRPVDLVTRLFATLRARAADEIPAFAGKPPTSVVLTLPAAGAGSGPVVEKIMRAAAAAAGFTDVDLVTEPEGAATAWQHEEGAGQDDVVVILDGGGGTVDWACLKRVDGALRLFPDCPPGGDDKVGGEYLDEDLFAILVSKLEAREAGDALGTVQGQANKWFSRIRGLRERFNRTGKVGTQDAMRVLGEVVSLDDCEVRGAVQDRFINQVCAGFGRYLDTVRLATGSTNPRVLLVGGTGQISGLQEALRDKCNCQPTWWQLSEFAPVIGAMWWGAERAGLPGVRGRSGVALAELPRPWPVRQATALDSASEAKAGAEKVAAQRVAAESAASDRVAERKDDRAPEAVASGAAAKIAADAAATKATADRAAAHRTIAQQVAGERAGATNAIALEAAAGDRAVAPEIAPAPGGAGRRATIAGASVLTVVGLGAVVLLGAGLVIVSVLASNRSSVVDQIGPTAGTASEPDIAPAPRASSSASPGADWESPTLGTMKWIPAGAFLMGSPITEAGRDADETQHKVTLRRGYWLMEHEVTQGEWQAITNSNPSTFKACGADCPVEQVSWDESVAFAKTASARDGVTYRLPTEAEWEYAARGGQSFRYAGGDDAAVGWLASNAGNTTHRVCTAATARNGYGLCDMSGNVSERVQDGYHPTYTGAPEDGSAWEGGSERVGRGGSWHSDLDEPRVANRNSGPPDSRRYYAGVRLVRASP